MKLTLRIFLYIFISQSLVLVAGSLFINSTNNRLLREVFSSRAQLSAQSLATAYGALYCSQGVEKAKKVLEQFRLEGSFEFAHIHHSDGYKIWLSSNELEKFSSLDPMENQSEFEKNNLFVTFAEIPGCKEGSTPSELAIGYDYHGLTKPIESYLKAQLAILIFQTLMLLIVTMLVGKYLSKHLGLIIKRCEKIASGIFDEETIFDKKSEFFIISETLNSMSRDLLRLQKEKEDQRIQLSAASKLSTLGEMAGGIAHEINNPLAVIKGRSLMLKKNLESENPDPKLTEKTIKNIDDTVERIAKIIKGLRSFAREGSNDPFEIVPLKSVVDDTLALCQSKFDSNVIALRTKFENEDLKVNCRATEVSQVLLNLLNNSYDAVLESKEKWVEIALKDDGEFVELAITDSGPPIPDQVKEKMFQPFYTTKPVGKGTGLGLSISLGIIKNHGGSLDIDRESTATRIVMKLPKA